jgi:hypothetical protein
MQLKIGNKVQTKWGGIGTIIEREDKLYFSFEDGDFLLKVTHKEIEKREIILIN